MLGMGCDIFAIDVRESHCVNVGGLSTCSLSLLLRLEWLHQSRQLLLLNEPVFPGLESGLQVCDQFMLNGFALLSRDQDAGNSQTVIF